MNVPPQFTAAGVGSAIPIDQLGSVDHSVTEYDFVGTTTKLATIIQPTTIAATTINGSPIPAKTIPGTTLAPTTIVGTALPTASANTGVASGHTRSIYLVLLSFCIAWC